MFEFMTIRELFEIVLSGSHVEIDSVEYVQLQGWIRTNRSSGKIGFIELNDGSFFKNIQIVFEAERLENYEEISKQNVGAALIIKGLLVETPEAKQPFEVKATQIDVEGTSTPDYPLQEKTPLRRISA